MEETIKYPADRVVHWASGPVNTCEEHGNQLLTVAKVLGTHVAVTTLDEPAECKNCVSEATKQGADNEHS